jgi:hypothetical protein
LDDYLARIAGRADLIPISADVVYRELRLIKETELDRDDALILASILSHAKTDASDKKAFLTKNVNDFQKQPVRDLLALAGLKLFSSTENLLGWAVGDAE